MSLQFLLIRSLLFNFLEIRTPRLKKKSDLTLNLYFFSPTFPFRNIFFAGQSLIKHLQYKISWKFIQGFSGHYGQTNRSHGEITRRNFGTSHYQHDRIQRSKHITSYSYLLHIDISFIVDNTQYVQVSEHSQMSVSFRDHRPSYGNPGY
jgi:hypothetical protein